MGLFLTALPNAVPQRSGVSFIGAAAAHAAMIGLVFATGAPQQLAHMAEPIAVRLIELAPESPAPAPAPPQVTPPPRPKVPVRAIEPSPVIAPAAAFAVPPAPTFAAPAPAAAPPPVVAAATAEPLLTAARFDAAYLANPKPAYPPASRRLGEEGRVVLRVYVGTDGLAEKVEIKNTSGFARLDAAAHDAVVRWRFVPARRGEQAVAAWVLVPIVFNLES
jgi:protein TonB